MNRDNDRQTSIILAVLGILPIVWLGLLIAPSVKGGLPEILPSLMNVMSDPFHIVLCEDSVKTVLVLLLCYGMGIGIYFSTRRNYRRREEHGSAKWGNAKAVDKKYRQNPPTENKLMTQAVRIGLNGKKHRRNLNTLVCGGSGAGILGPFSSAIAARRTLAHSTRSSWNATRSSSRIRSASFVSAGKSKPSPISPKRTTSADAAFLAVIANSTALSTALKAASLPGCLCRCIRHEVFSPWKAVAECPVLFIECRDSSNDVSVDQRAQNRSPLYALKVPKPKDEKAHRHAN